MNTCTDKYSLGIYELISSVVDIGGMFIGSTLFSVILATFAAAFAGAYGAQYFTEKNKKKAALLKEARNTNAAIMVAFSICNTCLSLKKQHVKSLKETFDESKEELLKHKQDIQGGRINPKTVFDFRADLHFIPPLVIPIITLEKQVFEHISAKGRVLSLTITLISSIESLNRSINSRNAYIDELREKRPIADGVMVELYFGLKDRDGNIDSNYPDFVDAIYSQTDDCIFFSSLLCADLNKHGNDLRMVMSDKLPKVNEPDFKMADELGLMPDRENYNDWLTMFKSHKEDELQKQLGSEN